MKRLFTKEHQEAETQQCKRQIAVQGILLSIIRPGLPVMYQYMDNVIRTSNVQAIREVSVHHVSFETENSIYTVSFENAAAAGF